MSSNHTEHYNLSQWERTDKVLMDDFNADNAKIDAALKSVADAQAAAQASLAQHGGALAKLGNCAIYTTTYTGDGSRERSYQFPGYPVFVYIQCPNMNFQYVFMRGLENALALEYAARWSPRSLTLTNPVSVTSGTNLQNTQFFLLALMDMSK